MSKLKIFKIKKQIPFFLLVLSGLFLSACNFNKLISSPRANITQPLEPFLKDLYKNNNQNQYFQVSQFNNNAKDLTIFKYMNSRSISLISTYTDNIKFTKLNEITSYLGTGFI